MKQRNTAAQVSLRQWAEFLAKLGFRLVPLKAYTRKNGVRKYKPTIEAWPQRATTDLDEFARWPGTDPLRALGIATGVESGIVVVDIDSDAARQTWEREYADDLPTPWLTVRTNRGWHLYFACEYPVAKSVGKLAPDIDILGEGSHAVAPGSPHLKGGFYELDRVSRGPDKSRLTEQQARMLGPDPAERKRRQHTSTTMPTAVQATSADHAFVLAVVARGVEDVKGAQEGTRNDTLNKRMYENARMEHTLDEAMRSNVHARFEAAAQHAGLNDQEITDTMRSALQAGHADPIPDPLGDHVERACRALALASWEVTEDVHQRWAYCKVGWALADLMRSQRSIYDVAIGVRGLADAARVSQGTAVKALEIFTAAGLVACEVTNRFGHAYKLSAMAWEPEHVHAGADYAWRAVTPDFFTEDPWGHADCNASGAFIYLACAQGEQTRAEIAEVLGMSKSTVSTAVARMIDLELLTENDHGVMRGPEHPASVRSYPISRKHRDDMRNAHARAQFRAHGATRASSNNSSQPGSIRKVFGPSSLRKLRGRGKVRRVRTRSSSEARHHIDTLRASPVATLSRGPIRRRDRHDSGHAAGTQGAHRAAQRRNSRHRGRSPPQAADGAERRRALFAHAPSGWLVRIEHKAKRLNAERISNWR